MQFYWFLLFYSFSGILSLVKILPLSLCTVISIMSIGIWKRLSEREQHLWVYKSASITTQRWTAPSPLSTGGSEMRECRRDWNCRRPSGVFDLLSPPPVFSRMAAPISCLQQQWAIQYSSHTLPSLPPCPETPEKMWLVRKACCLMTDCATIQS